MLGGFYEARDLAGSEALTLCGAASDGFFEALLLGGASTGTFTSSVSTGVTNTLDHASPALLFCLYMCSLYSTALPCN